MEMRDKAKQSIEEALYNLKNKSPRSTLIERWFLLEEARALYEHLPQPICVGKGMNYIVERASLPIAEHDLFLGRFIDKIPDEAEEARFQSIISNENHGKNPIISLTTGHITLDWESILSLGISGYIKKAESRLSELERTGAAEESKIIIAGLRLCYEAYRKYIVRYAETAQGAGRDDLAEVCEALAVNSPKTFREALQLIIFVLTVYYVYASAKVSCLTLGRLDELLLPYYRNDLANGIMTDEEAACLIDDFYAKTNLTLGRGEHQMSNSPNNPNNTGWERNPLYDSPTYILLGGKSSKRDTSEENPLTELFLRRIQPGFKHPVVIFRWSEECPDSHWHLLCEKLSAGSSILVYNDETMIPAMIHAGVEPDDAFGYSIHPCNWPDIDGGFCAVAPLGEPIPKMIMRVLMGEERKNFETIDEIYSALAEDFRERAKAVFSDYRLRFRSDKTQPVWCAISGTDCFTRGVIESARNHMDGGVKYPAIYTVLRNIGTAADMMTALDKAVYREKLRSLAEIRAALDTNFAEDSELLAYCRKAPKYGTDSEEADSHAVRLMKTLLDVIDEESVNESGVRDVISMNITTTDMWHIGEGASLGATPDGRLAGEPLSENLSPTVGVNEGVTALLNSVSKLPFKRIHAGAFNLRLTKSMVRGEKGIELLGMLLAAFFKNGGMQFQLSIADTEELREAQRCPEKYGDLLVRITGYSARFTDMIESAQNEIIRREELR